MENNQNLIKIFEYALNQEKTGMSFFETSVERLGVGAAVTAFKQIVEEEKRGKRPTKNFSRNSEINSRIPTLKCLGVGNDCQDQSPDS